jgi:hypothetical protein
MKNWTIFAAETLFNFGKHKGKTLEQVAETDAPYIYWCVNNIPEFLIDQSDFIAYALKYATWFDDVNVLGKVVKCELAFNSYVLKDADLLLNQNKWASYEEYMEMLSNADEGDYDYSDFLFNGFFEGDSDLYNEYMG